MTETGYDKNIPAFSCHSIFFLLPRVASTRLRSASLGGLTLARPYKTWYNPRLQLRFPVLANAKEK
jgi:hypothetical protein